MHPPCGAFVKSSADEASIFLSGCFGQHKGNDIPITDLLCKWFLILFHSLFFVAIIEILPIQYNAFFALDKATQTRFGIFRKPIFPFLLLLTNDNIIMSLSSPWKLSTELIRIPSKESFGI
jgi:hypothetical protein